MPLLEDTPRRSRGASLSFTAAVLTAVVSCALLWWSNTSWHAGSRNALQVLEHMRLARAEVSRGYLLTERAMAGETALEGAGQCDYFRQAAARAEDALAVINTMGERSDVAGIRRIAERFEYYNGTIQRVERLACDIPTDGSLFQNADLIRKSMADVVRIQEGLSLDMNALFEEMLADREAMGYTVIAYWGAFAALLLSLAGLAGRKRRKAEALLRQSEDRFRLLVESSLDAIFIQLGGKFHYANPACLSLFGTGGEQDLLGSPVLERVHPEERQAVLERIRRLNEQREKVPLREQRMLRLDGTAFWVEIAAVPVTFQDSHGALVYARDITERRRHEEDILRSLREKEVLLKEVHHRVKNNLQIINSLIYLQAQAIDDPAEQSRFMILQGRVLSMALIHEHLYRSEDLGAIDMGAYIAELVSRIASLVDLDKTIRVELDFQEVRLQLETAVPCGLVVNELVTNSYKHAFVDRKEGKIALSMRREGGDLLLTIRDDGPGDPAALGEDAQDRLGVKLVHELARQLKGTIALRREDGFVAELRFPAPQAVDWVKPA